MSDNNDLFPLRTIILIIVFVPVIAYLVNFAYKKNNESESRAQECRVECEESDYQGYEFKWTVLGGPQCDCLDTED